MSRILVTGGLGFIGRHAVQALEEAGHEIVLLTRKKITDLSPNNYLVGDLLKEGEPERIVKEARADLLLHLAWETEHGQFWHAESNHLWLKQSIELVTSFWQNGGRRAVCAGTCAEYDWSAGSTAVDLDERNTALNPDTMYGQSKLACYRELEALSRTKGSFAWGRVFLLFGVGETKTRFVPSIINNLLGNQEAPMSSGKQERDFLDSRDVGAAFAALLLSDVEGAVNVASGDAVRLLDLAKYIASEIGKPDLLKPGTFLDRENEPLRIVGANKRLINEVEFRPRFSLEEGLDNTLLYWKETHKRRK